jgi:hypothetical protein
VRILAIVDLYQSIVADFILGLSIGGALVSAPCSTGFSDGRNVMTKTKRLALAAAVAGISAFASMPANAFWGWGPFGMFPGGWGGPWNSPWYGGPYGYPYGAYGYPYGGYGVPYTWGAPHGWGLPLYGYQPYTPYTYAAVAPASASTSK